MADANYEAEQLARILEQLNQELRDHGMVSQETNRKLYDAQIKAKFGINNATAAFEKSGQAVGLLGKAAAQTASALYNNQKGASAFGSALDSVADAAMAASAGLMLLGGPLGIVAGGLALAGAAAVKYAKLAGEQSDALYKGFQDISKSGGAASDGLSGLFGDIQKLGLGFQDLGEYTKLVADSSRELAMFRGSVFRGRKEFANIGLQMAEFRDQLMNMGLSQTEINEGLMNYLRLQTRVGQTQNRTTEQLAESARKYLVEQDALTKLTGMTRKEQEDAREEVLSQERFAAKAAELRARGEGAKADEMVATYAMLRKYNKDAAQGFADLSTGMITTEAAQKSYFATQGEGMRVAQKVAAGQMTAVEATERLARIYGQTAKSLRPLALMGGFEDVAGSFTGAVELGILGQNDLNEQYKKIKEDQAKQGVKDGKAADAALDSQTKMRITQQNSMLSLQNLVNLGVEPATDAMEGLASVTELVTTGLEKLASFFGLDRQSAEEKKRRDAQLQKAEENLTKARQEYDKAFKGASVTQRLGFGRTQAQEAAASALHTATTQRREAMEPPGPRQPGAAGAPGAAEAPQGSVQGLLNFIGKHESGGDYNKLVGGKSAELTNMTIAEVMQLQEKMRASGDYESTAVGKYQIIAATLQEAVAATGLRLEDKFDQGTQDRLAKYLLEKRGLDRYLSKEITAEKFADNLAKEWAALPTARGQSYHEGVGTNKALVSRSELMAALPKFADGGVTRGPSIAGEAGPEAVIPLPNGNNIPVTMQGTDQLIHTIAELTAKLKIIQGADLVDTGRAVGAGAQEQIDKMTQLVAMATKESESRGVDVAAATEITPQQSVTELTAKLLEDIQTKQAEEMQVALKQNADDFKAAMQEVIGQMAQNTGAAGNEQMVGLLQELVNSNKNSVSVQEKLLRASAN